MSPSPVMMSMPREYQQQPQQQHQQQQHQLAEMTSSRPEQFFPNTKGLLNAPGQNNCFLNSAVQVPSAIASCNCDSKFQLESILKAQSSPAKVASKCPEICTKDVSRSGWVVSNDRVLTRWSRYVTDMTPTGLRHQKMLLSYLFL